MIDVVAPAERLLAAVVDHYEDNDWDLPPRRYLAPGQQSGVAVDDEHLCVAFGGLAGGTSENSRQGSVPGKGAGSATLPGAIYLLRLMRCVAVGDLDETGNVIVPTAAQITADARNVWADVGRLMTAVYAWAESEPPHLTVAPGPVEPHGPDGGFAGHSIRIRLAPAQALDVP